MINVLKFAWAKLDRVKIYELSDSILLFEFDKANGREAIMRLIPGHCLSLKPWDCCIALDDVDFDMLDMWIQIHELEFGKLSEDNAKIIV